MKSNAEPVSTRVSNSLFASGKSDHSELESITIGLGNLAAKNALLEARLAQLHTEMSTTARLLHERELFELRLRRDNAWLVAIGSLLSERPKWWFLALPGIQKRLLDRRLRRGKLFDGARYLSRYPDVVASGQDSLGHYIRHGLGEGRVNDILT